MRYLLRLFGVITLAILTSGSSILALNKPDGKPSDKCSLGKLGENNPQLPLNLKEMRGRVEFMKELQSLPIDTFNALLESFPGAPAFVSETAKIDKRALELISWSQGVGRPGLDGLQNNLIQILKEGPKLKETSPVNPFKLPDNFETYKTIETNTAKGRVLLIQILTQLPSPVLDRLIKSFPNCRSSISENGSIAEKVNQLLNWAEGVGHPGMGKVRDNLIEIYSNNQ